MKKKPVEVYFMNSNYLKKLYFAYFHQSKLDRFLDILVFFAILLTIITFIMDIFFRDFVYTQYLHIVSLVIILVFAFETLRDYIKSKSFRHYLSQHWIDFVLIIFLSFYFAFSGFFGLAKFRMLEFIKNFFEESKKIRVIFLTFFKK